MYIGVGKNVFFADVGHIPGFCGGRILFSFYFRGSLKTDKLDGRVEKEKDLIFELLYQSWRAGNGAMIFMADMQGGYAHEHVFKHVNDGEAVVYKGHTMVANVTESFINPNSGNAVLYCTARITDIEPSGGDDDDDEDDPGW